MSVQEMKSTLLKEIGEAEDAHFIIAMLSYSKILREDRNDKVYFLSEAQRSAVMEGKTAIERGEYLTDAEAEAELNHFFSEEEKKWGER